MLWSLETVWLVHEIIISLGKSTGSSAALRPRHMSNFKTVWLLSNPNFWASSLYRILHLMWYWNAPDPCLLDFVVRVFISSGNGLTAANHHPNQSQLIAHGTVLNKLHWNLDQNIMMLISKKIFLAIPLSPCMHCYKPNTYQASIRLQIR